MSHFDTFKTLGIFFAPMLIPWVLSRYRSLRAPNRVSPQPLPGLTSRSLNILFCSTALFLILSLPFSPHAPPANIFDLTSSRLKTPTDVLFSRLAELRPDQTLTPEDDLLRSKLRTVVGRELYLRYGADALLTCPFCSTDSPLSYLLYYLPFNTLIPHLFHLFILGLVTSAPLVGLEASRWRTIFIFTGFSLAATEIALVAFYDPSTHGTSGKHDRLAIPQHLHNRLYFARLVIFAVFDSLGAALIYLSATNRFFYTAPSAAEQTEQLITSVTATTAGTMSKIHGLGVAKNAIARDQTLSERSGSHWRGVREREAADDIWQEEEVVRTLNMVTKKRQEQQDKLMSSAGAPPAVGAKKSADASGVVERITADLEYE